MKELTEEIRECTAGSFLSRLWRKIVLLDGYYKILTPLMNDYIQKLTIQSITNTKISINRTNIHQKLLDPSMTWKNLMFLLKHIIRIIDLDTTIEINIDSTKFKYTEKGLNGNVISKLWDQIVLDVDNLNDLVENYHIREKANPNKVNKTNLSKKLNSSHDMTWNTLMFLIDEILIAREFSITLKLKNKRGTYTKHSVSYTIRDIGVCNGN